jgi:hypothetical protein
MERRLDLSVKIFFLFIVQNADEFLILIMMMPTNYLPIETVHSGRK